MALANITPDMSMRQASTQAAENIILQRKEFVRSLSDYQLTVFRTQLENAFEIGWTCAFEATS